MTDGKPTSQNRIAQPDERRQQYADTLTLTSGKHTFKVGADINRVSDLNFQLFNESGSYSYTNFKGDPITVRIEPFVDIETTSAASITFNINGSTGATGNQTVSVSMAINGSRNDRYTITITPSGTISSAYSTF